MESTYKHPKIHHFLPKGILRAFASGKKRRKIFFLNKHINKSAIKTNLKNVAGINKFYDYEGKELSLEVDFFGPIDNEISKVIKKLLVIEKISEADEGSFKIAAQYMASQICRVPYKSETFRDLEATFKDQIPSEVPFFEDGVKNFFLDYIVNNTKAYTDILLKKQMTIYRSKHAEFIIGDNPVVILDGGDKILTTGKCTCVVDAGVFMMPISPNNILVFFDDGKKDKVEEYIEHNNDWQFVNANKYVFALNSKQLEDELSIYHGNAYRYIAQQKPSLIEEQQLVEGQPISIGRPIVSVEGQAKKELLRMVTKKL